MGAIDRIKIYWKIILEHGAAIFGALATIVGLIGIWPKNVWVCIALTVALFIVSCTISAKSIVKKKKSVSFQVNGQTELKVFYGDLFAQDGAFVIPVNNYFDTHVGDGIVSPRTLHGQFITRFFQNGVEELDRMINEEIRRRNLLPNAQIHREPANMNLRRDSYPLGTCIRITVEGRPFILLVTSNFDVDNHAILNNSEYPMVVRGLYDGINELNDDNSVYMPIIGSGQASINCSQMMLMAHLIHGAYFADHLNIHNGINIVVYDDGKNKVDLRALDYIFNNIKLSAY